MKRRFIAGSALLGIAVVAPGAWGDCAPRLDEARAAVKEAEAAVSKAKDGGKAAARAPLARAKKVMLHAEAECKTAGGDVKKVAEAGREAREAQGLAEEAAEIGRTGPGHLNSTGAQGARETPASYSL